jgi:dTDP-4-amino-4,6-dideoxygalactose transaminase
MNTYKIPHFGLKRQYKNLKSELLEATDLAIRDGILVDGPYSKKFNEWLCKKTGATYAVLVHSGTQALELIALYWYIIAKNYDIETPTINIPNLTYVATFNAFHKVGFNINLVDTDKNGIFKIDTCPPSDFDCYVGLYGAHPLKHTKNVIVDGAQHWLVAETIGEAMAISFDPTKNLNATGNGGAIVTNNKYLFDFVTETRNNGNPNNNVWGTNSKLSELDCSHLLVRTKYIDSWQKRRREIRDFYIDQFNDLPIRCLSKGIQTHSDQKFVVYSDNRNGLKAHLEKNSIETKIHYELALSELPIAKINVSVKPDLMSNSILLSRGVLSLPIYPELTDNEVEYIASKVKDFHN